MKNFRTFILAKEFYSECQKLKLPGYLKNQLDRSSSSIALNLAEGYGRETPKDKKRFYIIALGSLRESQAVLKIVNAQFEITDLGDKLGAYLHNLVKYYSG